MGLDMSLRAHHRKQQQEVFLAQLDLARSLHRPGILHNIGHWDTLCSLLTDHPPWPSGLLIYNYQGPLGAIDALVGKGGYLCYDGDLLHWKPNKLKTLMEHIPADRLLLASNSPHSMPPRRFAPYQHFNITSVPFNEPANLPHIARGFAETRDMDTRDLAQLLNHNALCLFGPLIQNEG